MDPNLLFTQVTAGAAFAYLLKLVQQWKKIPWITEHTKELNAVIRAALAFAATVGIGYQWDGATHALTITGLSASAIFHGVWHWFGQYALQHGWGQVLNIGTLSKVEVPVEVEQKLPVPKTEQGSVVN